MRLTFRLLLLAVMFSTVLPTLATGQLQIPKSLKGRWWGNIRIVDGMDTITGKVNIGIGDVLATPDSDMEVQFSNFSSGGFGYFSRKKGRFNSDEATASFDSDFPVSGSKFSSCKGSVSLKALKYGETPILYGTFRSNSSQCIAPDVSIVLFEKSFTKKQSEVALVKLYSDVRLSMGEYVAEKNSLQTTKAPTVQSGQVSNMRKEPQNSENRSSQNSNTAPTAADAISKYPIVDFSIDAKYVTLPTDKEFKWFEWSTAPVDIKNATNAVPGRFREAIELTIADNNCEVQIAVVDLNFNGVLGFVVMDRGSFCCGTRGCSFSVLEDGGIWTSELGLDHEVKPAKNGVMSSSGRFFKLVRDEKFPLAEYQETMSRFKYNKVASLPVVKPSGKTYPGGAATPDALGRTLLTALQTNNKKLWLSCMHPVELGYQDYNARAFDRCREDLVEKGVTDWSQIKFSRVTYSKEPIVGGSDGGEVNGEKFYRRFLIEFTYKTDFLGVITYMTISTVNRAKYYVYFAGQGANLNRKEQVQRWNSR